MQRKWILYHKCKENMEYGKKKYETYYFGTFTQAVNKKKLNDIFQQINIVSLFFHKASSLKVMMQQLSSELDNRLLAIANCCRSPLHNL